MLYDAFETVFDPNHVLFNATAGDKITCLCLPHRSRASQPAQCLRLTSESPLCFVIGVPLGGSFRLGTFYENNLAQLLLNKRLSNNYCWRAWIQYVNDSRAAVLPRGSAVGSLPSTFFRTGPEIHKLVEFFIGRALGHPSIVETLDKKNADWLLRIILWSRKQKPAGLCDIHLPQLLRTNMSRKWDGKASFAWIVGLDSK